MTQAQPPTDAELAALLDQARTENAARERSRRRWLLQQAQEEARLTGVLLSAAEHHRAVAVRTRTGRTHSGTVVAVGPDCCTLQTSATLTIIRLGAVTVVLPDPTLRPGAAADHRVAPSGPSFAESLADRCGDGPHVSLGVEGQSEPLGGRLLAVGVDVATLEHDDAAGVAYVSLAAVSEAVFLASG